MQVWELSPGRLMIAGGFSDLAVHHHAAVQITVGGRGPLTVTRDGETHEACRLVVIASGVRHAVRSQPESGAVTLYLGLQTPQGIALNTIARPRVWVVDDGEHLAEATATLLDNDGPGAAADFLVDRLCGAQEPPPVHPQLRQAIEVVSSRVPDHIDVTSAASAVALSPDYLGRLAKQQNGISFSATIRWERLIAAVSYLLDGYSVTDAAHQAGFADGSHANKVCWEMTGATPSELADAVRRTLLRP
ncbi:helix-turn-helix domain-containing protein [Mycobacterium sp.]|uniref:helix-turn-helix transcriptional regulator n=1 Tax=Mycobacterium sp. TaxID=1785 RepID=UPI003C76B8A7